MLTEHSEFFSAQLPGQPSSSLSVPALHSEFDFLRRLKAHNEDAFETMVRCYGARMFATARKLLGNEHNARDGVQQAFISALGAIAGFNAVQHYRPGFIE
jgi:hypothetical protein